MTTNTTIASRSGSADPDRLWILAGAVRRCDVAYSRRVGLLLDDGARGFGRAYPDGGRQHDRAVFHLLNSRYLLDSSLSFTAHFGNKYLPLGIAAVVILQLSFTYAPPPQAVFGNEAVPIWGWPWLLAAGLAFFLVVEAERLVIRSSASLTPGGNFGGSWG